MALFEEFNKIKIIGILSNNNIKIVNKDNLQALPYNEDTIENQENDDDDDADYEVEDETFIVIPIDPSRKQFAFYNVKNEGFIYVDDKENVIFKKSDSTNLYNAGIFQVRSIDSTSVSILSTKTNKYLRIHPTDPNNKIDFFNDVHYGKDFPFDYVDGKWRFDIEIEEPDDDDGFEDELGENFENHGSTFDKIFAVLRRKQEPFWKKSSSKAFSKKKWSKGVKKMSKGVTNIFKKKKKKKDFKPGIESDLKVLAFLQNPDNHKQMIKDNIKVPTRNQQYNPSHGRKMYKQIGLEKLKEDYSSAIPDRITTPELTRIIKESEELNEKSKKYTELIEGKSIEGIKYSGLNNKIEDITKNTIGIQQKACGLFTEIHGESSENYQKPEMCIELDQDTSKSTSEVVDSFVVEGYSGRFKTHLGTYEGGVQGEHGGDRARHGIEQRESNMKDNIMARKNELLVNFNAELYKTRNENDYMQKTVSVNKDFLLNKQLEYVYAVEGETRMLEREMSNKDAKETTNHTKADFQSKQVGFLKTVNTHILFYIYIIIVIAYIVMSFETDTRNIYYKIFIYLCLLSFPFYVYPLEIVIYNIFSFINALFIGEPYKKTH